jgi:hypothetical protein
MPLRLLLVFEGHTLTWMLFAFVVDDEYVFSNRDDREDRPHSYFATDCGSSESCWKGKLVHST